MALHPASRWASGLPENAGYEDAGLRGLSWQPAAHQRWQYRARRSGVVVPDGLSASGQAEDSRTHAGGGSGGQPELAASLATPGHKAKIERALVIKVEAFDWNCPQHITQRFTLAEIEPAVSSLRAKIADLEAKLAERAA